MKANELRIGNYVAHPSKEFDQVEEIWCKETGEGVEYAIKSKECHIAYYLMHEGRELIRGIPLTENWLLKLGFTLYPWGYVKDQFLLSFYYLNGQNHFVFKVANGLSRDIHYVHELQNLFHALTGQELETINP